MSATVRLALALICAHLLFVAARGEGAAAALQFPQLTGRVVDEAGLLTPAERQSLAEALKAHEDATGNQVVVVTLRSLQGTPIEDYGYQLGRFWGIGQQGKDNGVLLIVAPNERKVRIEVGYGLEGALTDATSRMIIERIMTPAFRSGQFGPGIVAGVGAILKVISGEGSPLPHRRSIGADRSSVGLLPAILIFGGFVLFMWLVYRSQRSSYYASPGRRRGTWIGYGGASAAAGSAAADPVEAEDSAAAAASAAAAPPGAGDMPFLTESDTERIEQAVEAAEGHTAAEFVTVIAAASGHYLYLPTLAAAAAMLLLSGVALLIPWPFAVTVGQFYMGQVLGFIACYGLFRWWPVRRRLVPRHIQHERARHRAHQTFLDLGLASTRHRTGVLFFVSIAEHYVEIITDRGVGSVVDDRVWADTVSQFAATVRQGRIADGVVDAVNACARVLAERLPPRAGDVDELPNRPVEL